VRYISLFSGIEAATVAWHDLGWTPHRFAEFDAFPSMVLAHHYPTIPNVGDVMKHDWKQYKGQVDLIVGGSPCQSFSVAGQKLGLDDPRGNLALHYLRIVREVQPKWFVFENVPGLLSSNGGDDFSIFLREVAECGYGFAYRVLDAQHFGIPQRRRRVFVVGCADGDWRSAASVLFERESLSRDLKESKEKGKNASLFPQESIGGECRNDDGRGIVHCEKIGPTMTSSGPPYSRTGNQRVEAEALVVQKQTPLHDPAPPLDASYFKGAGMRAGIERQIISETIPIHDKATRFKGGGSGRNDDGGGNGFGVGEKDQVMWSLDTASKHAVFQQGSAESSFGTFQDSDKAGVLKASGGVLGGGSETLITEVESVVRRLTPIECERLQGFPDDYTKISWNGKAIEDCPDGHRYKALGNSMAVPVMRWIGERIEMANQLNLNEREKSKASVQTKLW
jgi:DNA (cytosine-5)-methyltransferase 1